MVSREQTSIRDGDEIDVVELIRVTWRYKYVILIVAAIFSLGAVYLALSATHIYRAEVKVTEVRNEGARGLNSLASQFGGLASMVGINLSGDGASHEAQAVLRSRYLAEEFVKRFGLVEALLPNAKQPATTWLAVNKFREGVLSISEDKERGITTITVDWTDPVVAARWANEFVALANEIMRARALDSSSRNVKYLREQVAQTDLVELQSVMYSLIESETRALMLANVREEYAFTVVDPAVVPERRSWPRRTLMVLTGSMLGIFVGVFLAFGHNAWRQFRIRE